MKKVQGHVDIGAEYEATALRFQFQLSSILMQVPRTSRASLVKGRSQANAVAQQALIAHWQSIVKSLNNYLTMMKANFVCQ